MSVAGAAYIKSKCAENSRAKKDTLSKEKSLIYRATYVLEGYPWDLYHTSNHVRTHSFQAS